MCAQSNAAVDELITRLDAKVPFLVAHAMKLLRAASATIWLASTGHLPAAKLAAGRLHLFLPDLSRV